MLTITPDVRLKLTAFSEVEIFVNLYDQIQNFSNESNQEMLSVAEELSYPDIHKMTSGEIKDIIMPSTQEDLKKFYAAIMQKMTERFAPHLPIRFNENTISVRISEPVIERIQHITNEVYEKDPYWGEYFNREYPRFANLLSRQKRAFEQISTDVTSLVYRKKVGQREYVYFNLTQQALEMAFANVFHSIQTGELSMRSHDLNPIENALYFFASTLILSEMYDGMKKITTEHAQKSQQSAMEKFTKQHTMFVDWYRENKIFSLERVAEVAGQEKMQFLADKGLDKLVVFPTIQPQVPKNMELLLYESLTDTDKWFATLMEPAHTVEDLQAPSHEGFKRPVIGKVTGFDEEKEQVVINDFFSLNISETAFIESLTKNTEDIRFPELSGADLEEYNTISKMMLGLIQVKDEVEEQEEVVIEEEAKETLTLEQLMERHGIKPVEEEVQQDAPVVIPAELIQRQQERAERDVIRIFPDNYRVTQTGNQFSLFYQGQLYIQLTSQMLKERMEELGILTEFPAMINMDADSTHMNTLEQPFVNLQRYLII